MFEDDKHNYLTKDRVQGGPPLHGVLSNTGSFVLNRDP